MCHIFEAPLSSNTNILIGLVAQGAPKYFLVFSIYDGPG